MLKYVQETKNDYVEFLKKLVSIRSYSGEEKERIKETGKVRSHAPQRREREDLSILPFKVQDEAAREVIFRCVVLAGMPRAVRIARERALATSLARALCLFCGAISVLTFSMMRFPNKVPHPMQRAPIRTAALYFSSPRDAEIARDINF